MQRISSRQPLLLGIGVTLTFMFGLLFAVLVLPDSVVPAGKVAIRMLVPVALLTILGLWRTAGFTRRPTWSNLWPFLPLLLIPLVPAIFGTGVTITDPAEIALLVLMNFTVGFGEEATFRGVVLRVLAPRGLMRAAVLSSVLFGAMHLVNLAVGEHPVNVGFQVIYTVELGFAYASAALVTGAIWPLVLIHFAQDFANAIQTSNTGSGSPGGVDLASGLINVALWLPFVVYGYWLLRHHLRQSGSEDERPGPRVPAMSAEDVTLGRGRARRSAG